MGNEDNIRSTYSIYMKMEDGNFNRKILTEMVCSYVFSDRRYNDRFRTLFIDRLHTMSDVLTIIIKDEDLTDDDIIFHLTLYGLYFDPIYTEIIDIMINDLLTFIENSI